MAPETSKIPYFPYTNFRTAQPASQFESNLTVAGVAAYSKRFFDEIPLHLSWMRSSYAPPLT